MLVLVSENYFKVIIRSKIGFRCLSASKAARFWIVYKIEKLYYLIGPINLGVLALVQGSRDVKVETGS